MTNNFIYDKITLTKETICINEFDININGKQLFEKSSLSMSKGIIYGLIGKNGTGKTTLLNNLFSLKIDMVYVKQENIFDERNPLEYILDSNFKFIQNQKEIYELEQNEYYDINELNEKILLWNPEYEKSKICKILTGLGFSLSDLEKPCNIFSGGWQMRISLARAIYLEPLLLLLDEPTNHLDLDATIWLSEYLQSWKHTVICVSHNIGFLNDVCKSILHIEDKKLIMYKGNYNKFKLALNNKEKENEKLWIKFDKKCKELKNKGQKEELKNYINKNFIKRPEKQDNSTIIFGNPNNIKGNIISFNNVSFSYDKEILSNINLGLDMDSRICIVGKNGSGKSTLIKLIVDGHNNIIKNSQAKIGYYNQHFENQLPLDKRIIEYLQNINTNFNVQTIRSYLGTIGLESKSHTKLIGELSGGQKARVALVKLILLQPDFIILDEPTNHLDIETIEKLIDGLKEFTGGILIITHDSNLIETLNMQIVMLDNKVINYKINTFDKYYDYIINYQSMV